MTTWKSLARAIERVISEEIANLTQDLWDENAITFNLVRRIRPLLATNIFGDREKTAVQARLFKARGTNVETKFGDLAVLLLFTFRDGTSLEGVAFYESKKREWNSQKLASIRKGQLKRIHNNLWSARLLVYDREPILSAAFEAEGQDWYDAFVERVLLDDGGLVLTHPTRAPMSLPFTNAGTIPLGPVLATGRHDTSLYKYAFPLSYQLCFRNLQGLDLDHDPEVISATMGQSRAYGVPRTTLVVSVRRGPGEGLPPVPDINEDALEPVNN